MVAGARGMVGRPGGKRRFWICFGGSVGTVWGLETVTMKSACLAI